MTNEQLAVDYVIDRMDKIESRLEKFIEENTKRLDNLIELTRHMSAMNERQLRHSDDISDMKARLTQIENNSNASIARVHARVDELSKDFGKDMDIMKTAMIEKMAKVAAECEAKQSKNTQDCENKLAAVNIKTNAIKNELTKWLNRGMGAWFILALIASGLEWYIKISMENQQEAIIQLQLSDSKQAATLNQINTTVNNISAATKTNEE